MRVRFESVTPIVRATLNFTTSHGAWIDREWRSLPAAIDGSAKVAIGELPSDASVAYINLVDVCGHTVSSEHIVL
jgi:hypothetical protein